MKQQAPGQRCIYKIDPRTKEGLSSQGEALCNKGYSPFILDLEHALACIASGSYVYPCPKCLKIAAEQRYLNGKK